MSAARPNRLLTALVLAVGSAQFVLIFRFEVNWDEFLNLSMLYEHQRGELREILQTAFIHLFHWVPLLSQNEVTQVIAARCLVAGFALVTSLAIWATARHLTNHDGGKIAVFAYWSVSYVMQHGLALRTDTLAAAPIMVALWLTVTRWQDMRAILGAGLLLGLASALTIKAVFFMPMLLIVALVQMWGRIPVTQILCWVLLAGLAATCAFLAIIGLHSLTFNGFDSPLAFLDRTKDATLQARDYSIFRSYALYGVFHNPLFFVLLFIGVIRALEQLATPAARRMGLVSLALLVPLFVPLVYRDMYPYFYALLLPPVAVATAYGLNTFQRFSHVTVAVLVAFWVWNLGNALYQSNGHQARILDVVHQSFAPESTYLDGRSMVSSYAKRGLFMSTWGMTDYRAQGRAIYTDLLRRETPVFLLVNAAALYFDRFNPEAVEAHPHGLLAEDFTVLHDSFVPFWGPIRVPGRVVDPEMDAIEIFTPGLYANRGPGILTIDEMTLDPGAEAMLDAGHYRVKTLNTSTLALAVNPPTEAAPKGPVFHGFMYAPFTLSGGPLVMLSLSKTRLTLLGPTGSKLRKWPEFRTFVNTVNLGLLH
ncbi:glycosyltransferase family 39 protein [Loktanella sp. DJP18]|uniref:glycosyltransferase family 39 protein n=1 Tax=Loktanella sp. DJP18 TaxID=3409788 RepID=UPI003BB7E537